MRNRERGFTLIEILVVITIIASLAGAVLILVPRIQQKQKQTTCANHLRQLGTLYTMIAGLLNVLAIYDAASGPFMPPPPSQDKPPPKSEGSQRKKKR